MSWKDDMLNAMSDESFLDCLLVGSDGGKVPCAKLFLASNSQYFKTLFFGEAQQQESGRGCHHLNYPSIVLRIVVKFCHSGDVDLSLILNDEACLRKRDKASVLVKLRDAGRYLQLDQVVTCTEKQVGDFVFRNGDVDFAWMLLAALMSKGPSGKSSFTT